MNRIEIDVLSEESNCPVVKLPGRKFPGVILQGDSLKILCDAAMEIIELSSRGSKEDLRAAAASLGEKLAGFLAVYEQTLYANGIRLPYRETTSGE